LNCCQSFELNFFLKLIGPFFPPIKFSGAHKQFCMFKDSGNN
jgi:hypothetical protein